MNTPYTLTDANGALLDLLAPGDSSPAIRGNAPMLIETDKGFEPAKHIYAHYHNDELLGVVVSAKEFDHD